MKKTVYIFLLCAVPLSLNAYSFTRAMRIGSAGQDVLELQKVLNADVRTQVTTQGDGSKGHETTYFGQKTKQAVINLQNLFSAQILAPVGLSVGNGFVGNSTLKFLNSYNATTSTNTSTSPSADTQYRSEEEPAIESVTPVNVEDGDTVTIIGRNFSPTDNTLILGFESKDGYKNIPSTNNGTKIVFKYHSTIQEVFDDKYGDMDNDDLDDVKDKFKPVPIAVSVIPKNNIQSNFITINFHLD
jgi:hypothetical protein